MLFAFAFAIAREIRMLAMLGISGAAIGYSCGSHWCSTGTLIGVICGVLLLVRDSFDQDERLFNEENFNEVFGRKPNGQELDTE